MVAKYQSHYVTATLPATDSQGSGMRAEEFNTKAIVPPIYNVLKAGGIKKSQYLREAARPMVLQISSLPEASGSIAPNTRSQGSPEGPRNVTATNSPGLLMQEVGGPP